MAGIIDDILEKLAKEGNFLNISVIDTNSGLHLGAKSQVNMPQEILELGAAAFTEIIRPSKVKYIKEYISKFENNHPQEISFESVVISTEKTKHLLIRLKQSQFYLLITMDKKEKINIENIKPYLNDLINILSGFM